MGATASTTGIAQALAKWDPEKFIRGLSFGAVQAPEFWQDRYIEAFQHVPESCSSKSIHKPHDLALLLFGFLEQIEDPESILETMLVSDLRDPSAICYTLRNLFELYVTISSVRSSVFQASAELSKQIFSPFSLLSSVTRETTRPLDFDSLYDSLEYVFRLANGGTSTEPTMFKPMLKHLSTSSPASAISPPASPFAATGDGNTETFSAQGVYSHGISCNGQFLFVLCSDGIIQIFPVFVGGLAPPLVRKVTFPLRDGASLVSDRENVIVVSGAWSYTIKIRDLLSNDEVSASTTSSFHAGGRVLGDGVVVIQILPELKYVVTDGNRQTLMNGVLQPGLAQPHMSFPSMALSSTEWDEAAMETNGSEIAMILTRDQLTIFRVFSLLSGMHIHDEIFELNEQLIGLTMDSYNKCHWGVVALSPGRYQVKRFGYVGACDPFMLKLSPFQCPQKAHYAAGELFAVFISGLNFHIRHLIGGQMIPSLFLCTRMDQFSAMINIVKELCNLSKKQTERFGGAYQAGLQVICALISMNLKRLICTCVVPPDIKPRLCELVTMVPRNMGFLVFFNHVDFFLEDPDELSLTIMVELLKSVADDQLLAFALRELKFSANIALIPFDTNNAVSVLVPHSSAPRTSIPPPLLTLLLIHQRALVAKTQKYLRENPFVDIEFRRVRKESKITDYFREYAQVIIQKFDAAIAMCQTYEELENSVAMILFENFLCLLSSLAEFHSVSRVVTGLLVVLVQKISRYISENLVSDSTLHRFVMFFVYIYGKFASTLVMGGYVSDFEKKYFWLIKANLNMIREPNLIDNLASLELTGFPDERFDLILSGEGNFMSHVYKKYKPQFNRKLSEEVMKLDRLVISAVAKHTNCLTELLFFDGTETPSRNLKAAMDQMLRVRNEYRTLVQRGRATSSLFEKCLMLIRMESDGNTQAKSIGDFVLSSFDASRVCQILKGQETRILTTLVGFSLIDKTYRLNAHPIWSRIIGYCLGQIEKFEGLASIVKITKLTWQQTHQVDTFFENVLQNIRLSMDTEAKRDNDYLILMAYRFFRDVDVIQNVQCKFCNGIIELYNQYSQRQCLLATAFSLMPAINVIPACLDGVPQNPLNLLLLAEAVKYKQPSESLPRMIYQGLRSFKQYSVRGWLRVLLRTLTVMNQSLQIEMFHAMFTEITRSFTNLGDVSIASELIQFLRRILKENLPCKPVLIDCMRNVCQDGDDTTKRIAVWAVLGSQMENFRPFSKLRYVSEANEVSEFLVFWTEENSDWIVYAYPFNIAEPPREAPVRTHTTQLYATSVVDIAYEDFPYSDIILDSWSCYFNNINCAISCLYAQTIAAMCKSPEFIASLNAKMIAKIAGYCIPIIDTYSVQCNLVMLNALERLPCVDGFSVLDNKKGEYVSYLSQIIRPDNDAFSVRFHVRQGISSCFVGIIADNYERMGRMYSIFECKTGIVHPTAERGPSIKRGQELTLTVIPQKRVFSVGAMEIPFPLGLKHRILFVAKRKNTVSITPNDAYMTQDSWYQPENPYVDDPFTVDNREIARFRHAPPSNPLDLPKTHPYLTENHGKYLKMQLNPPPAPEDIPLVFCGKSSTSEPLIRDFINCTFGKLTMQWCTVALMRIANANLELVKDFAVALFSNLVLSLELFSVELLQTHNFPFRLDEPIWHEQSKTVRLHLLLEAEAKLALGRILDDQQCLDQISYVLIRDSLSKARHLACCPTETHTYHFCTSGQRLFVPPLSMVCVNDFLGPQSEVKSRLSGLPQIALEPLELVVTSERRPRLELSVMVFDPRDNTWMIGTPFQLLVLLKNFVFAAKTSANRAAAKTVVLNCFICASPFVYTFLPELIGFLQMQIPSTPLDRGPYYMDTLMIAGSMAVARNCGYLISFYQQEQRVLTSPVAVNLSCHFPEFFAGALKPPQSRTCRLEVAHLDPGAIKSGFSEHIQVLRLFSKEYRSLIGFPFWEILPLWLRITGAGKGRSDYVETTVNRINSEVSCVKNPGSERRVIVLRPRRGLPRDIIIMYSQSALFEDANYIQVQNIHEPISIDPGETYFSIVGCPNPWDEVEIDIISDRKKRQDAKWEDVDILSIHDQFVADMTVFAMKWNSTHTDELLNIIPRFALREPVFNTVASFAKGSSLCYEFPVSVVLLRALIIHHFNFIRAHHFSDVPSVVWETFTRFVAIEDAAEAIISSIPTTNLDYKKVQCVTIDRHAAQRLVLDGRGDSSSSIIAQLSPQVKSAGAAKFRNKLPPWFVRFKDEEAIDAGGPSRELMTEAAASIFQPTSELFIQTPDMRRGQCQSYIPTPGNNPSKHTEYWTIGVFLGMVVRTGFYQDFPFAPMVWNYLVGDQITIADVIAVDAELGELFKHLREGQITATWTVTDWTGTVVKIPGHSAGAVERSQTEIYIAECVKYRISQLVPALDRMRRGFCDNVGFSQHKLLTGSLLSRLTQGNPVVTVDHLKSITRLIGFKQGQESPYIRRFWRVVDKFTDEQRKLLLKFITTLTRIPNTNGANEFVIKIAPLVKPNPDSQLPTAATCFNRLNLPPYTNDDVAYQKILLAIQLCQTMENK